MNTKPTLDETIRSEYFSFCYSIVDNKEPGNLREYYFSAGMRAALTTSFLAQLPNELLKEHPGVIKLLSLCKSVINHGDEALKGDGPCFDPVEDEARAALKEWE